jgi:thymidylate synthase
VDRRAVRWDSTYAALLRELRDTGHRIGPSKGEAKELIAKQFSLPDPRDRCLSNPAREFNPFQALGHWLWVMAGRMDLQSIQYYNPGVGKFSADRRKLDGAYGPRLFGLGALDQIPRVVQLIRERPATRRGVATVYIPEFDTVRRNVEGREDEVPCTIALQYLPRDGVLHAFSYMRSQDVPNVLPYDVFIFTLIQEYVARNTDNELGEYHHVSGSFHYYTRDEARVAKFIDAAAAGPPLMPSMPKGNQDEVLARVVGLEENIRSDALARMRVPGGSRYNPRPYFEQAAELSDFWKTVVLALVAHAAIRLGEIETLSAVHPQIGQPFKLFVERALARSRATTSLERFETGAG